MGEITHLMIRRHFRLQMNSEILKIGRWTNFQIELHFSM